MAPLKYLPSCLSLGFGRYAAYIVGRFLGLMVYLDPDQAVGSLHQLVGPRGGNACVFLSSVFHVFC